MAVQPLPPQPPMTAPLAGTDPPAVNWNTYFPALDKALRSLLASFTSLGSAVLLIAGGQNITGGFTETEQVIPTPTNGSTITPSPLTSLKQVVTNNVAGFTIAASNLVGDVELRVINGASAGAISFSGFTKKWTSDALDTVNGHQFIIFLYGFGGSTSSYIIKAQQ